MKSLFRDVTKLLLHVIWIYITIIFVADLLPQLLNAYLKYVISSLFVIFASVPVTLGTFMLIDWGKVWKQEYVSFRNKSKIY
ncbi:MAG: hypothetical protein IIC76_00700 [Bacteroidetes bacterium]|nr:hypothetical protein [Bacteroidota bacterium]